MSDKTPMLALLQTHLPFMAVFTKDQIEQRPLLTRVIEGVIIAAAGGALSAYIALTNVQSTTTAQLQDLKEEVAQQHRDTMQEIQALQTEVVAARQSYYPSPGPGPHGS